jgi:citronellol/citronellal dehydrogenase
MADARLGRKPEIMADAAHAVLTRDPRQCTGNFFIDDEVLKQAGVSELDQYAVTPGNRKFLPDLFVD